MSTYLERKLDDLQARSDELRGEVARIVGKYSARNERCENGNNADLAAVVAELEVALARTLAHTLGGSL
ncbi:hypothetical protein [Amycolatopsis sp. NBC_01480]|uniref:hypothetical protein n=1 Tax=Amycolatopsis sp. NBC_01480 TaxID=2903562 RepID=UPI002E27C875|nr:hypothetical protein [Amycolatopsis sp. NBC_01480]